MQAQTFHMLITKVGSEPISAEMPLSRVAARLAQLAREAGKPAVGESGDWAAFAFSDGTLVGVTGATVAQIRKAYVAPTGPCTRCGGDGVYKWGTINNGVPEHQGVCFRCWGDGREPAS